MLNVVKAYHRARQMGNPASDLPPTYQMRHPRLLSERTGYRGGWFLRLARAYSPARMPIKALLSGHIPKCTAIGVVIAGAVVEAYVVRTAARELFIQSD